MKIKSYNKKRLFALMMLPMLVTSLANTIPVSSAHAFSLLPDYSIVSTTYNSYTLTSGEWLSVSNSGAIYADPTAVEVDSGAVGVTIDNSGTIEAVDYTVNTIFVGDQSVGVNITNYTSALIAAQAEGHAVGVGYEGDISGTLDNAGTISAYASNSSYATAHGVLAAGDLLNLLDNSGTISADANASSWSAYAKAVGVTVDTVIGTLDNSGSISAHAEGWASTSATVTARGIVMGTLTGTLDNSGTISAEADAYSSNGEGYATAVGIDMGTLTGTLINGDGEGNGVIEAYADATGSTTANAVATGIAMGALTGSLDNSGTIYAEADASSATWNTATAIGIKMGTLVGTLNNSGRIEAESDADDSYAYAYAIGIEMGVLDADGTLINSGSGGEGEGGIIVDAHADADGNYAAAEGAGIAMGYLEGKLDNKGLIDVTVKAHGYTGASARADAFGITLGTLAGTLDNSGTIAAYAEGQAHGWSNVANAYAAGIDMDTLAGTLINSGSIRADADATAWSYNAYAGADGIYLAGDLVSAETLTNSGTIVADAYAYAEGDAEAEAFGILVDGEDGISGHLDNDGGEIRAEASAYSTYSYDVYASYLASASAAGIAVTGEGGISGTLDNSGTISAAADAKGYTNAMATAAGIFVGNLDAGFLGDLTGSLNNVSFDGEDGLISAEADASASYQASANAMGILMGDLVGADTLVNSGTISADAYAGEPTNLSGYAADYAYANAGGIVMAGEDGLSGVLDNSGSIYANADAKAYTQPVANAAGIAVGGENGLSGTLDNSGTVRAESWAYAEGSGNTATANAYGVVIGGMNPDPYVGDLSGTLLNGSADGEGGISGLIDAYAEASGSYANASAAGMLMGDLTDTGSLDNSGTITARAEASATFLANANAAGIDMGALYGTLENSGSIGASAEGWADTYQANAIADGIRMGDLVSPDTLNNSGTISAEASAYSNAEGYADANAYATGINNAGDLVGVLDNSAGAEGSGIRAFAYAYASYNNALAEAVGVDAEGAISGTLDNSGTIRAEADAYAYRYYTYTANANAHGVDVASIDSLGRLENSGSIDADAYANGFRANASASGVILDGNIDGTLDNLAGTIRAAASAAGTYAQAMAYGVNMGDLYGTLDNSGSIGAEADAYGSYQATANAYGIFMQNLVSGETLDNSGTISADAYAYSSYYPMVYARATAIDINGKDGLTGELVNTKTIQAMATASASYQNLAFAEGVSIAAGLSGTLDNSGTISAEADASGTYVLVNAAGITVNGEGGISGLLDNSGSVSANAGGFGASYHNDADAVGIAANGEGGISGTLDNEGTISAVASLSNTYLYGNANAHATGVATNDLNGLLDNSGSIGAQADATASSYMAHAYATGVRLNDIYGTLDNSGTISADANAYGQDYAYAYAEGIKLTNLYSQESLENNDGLIEGKAYASAIYAGGDAYAYAYGIKMSNIDGLLYNSGTISAEADVDAPGTGLAYAEGISLATLTKGDTLDNDGGTIKGDAYAAGGTDPRAKAYGINLGDLDGTLDNSGFIGAHAQAVGDPSANNRSASAYAWGIHLSDLNGTLDNSGTISAETHVTDDYSAEAYATGVYMNNLYGLTTLDNSGTISVAVYSKGGDYAYATDVVGVRITNTLSGFMENSGLIEAYGQATATSRAQVKVQGVEASTLSGTLDNSGTITAQAVASAPSIYESYAYGVHVTNLTGTLNNRGTISGQSNEADSGYSVYASYGGGDVNNQTGGLLSGNLYLGVNVDLYNSGTVALPLAVSAYVGDDYFQAEGGTLAIEALNAGQDGYSNLRVGDTASFDEGTTIDVTAVALNSLATGDVLDNVVDANALNYYGSMEEPTITVTDNSALLDFTAIVDEGSNIDLNVLRNLIADMIEEDGSTGSSGLAELLDEMLLNSDEYPGLEDLLTVLNELDTEQEVVDAVNQLVPVLNGDVRRAVFDALWETRRIVRVRQDDNKGMNSGDDIAVQRNVWGKVFGSKADQDGNNGAFGYKADSIGIIFGADTEISARATVGAALAYVQSDVEDGDRVGGHDAEVDSYQAILYGSYDLGNDMTLGWQADYAVHNNDTERNIPLFGTNAKGDYDSWSTHFGLDIDRRYAISEQTTLVPSVRLDYTYIDEDGYTETGAGPLNLKVSGTDADELILGIDGKVLYNLNDSAMFTANLGVGYDVLADEESITTAFAGAPGAAFKTNGIDPEPWMINAGVGVEIGAKDGVQVNVRYDIEGRDDYTNQSVSLKVNVPF